ncbi:MAG: hypothetical protein ACLFR0_08855 [Alphaproteobacteria bacterium]
MKNLLSISSILLILCLVTMGVVKIWIPDAISNDAFVKIVVTFGLITLGSMAILFLSRNEAEKQEKE